MVLMPSQDHQELPASPDILTNVICVRFWCRFSSGSIGKASRTSSNAVRLGLLPEEPEEDEDMYEAPVPASDILVDGFIVPKEEIFCFTLMCQPPEGQAPQEHALWETGHLNVKACIAALEPEKGADMTEMHVSASEILENMISLHLRWTDVSPHLCLSGIGNVNALQ